MREFTITFTSKPLILQYTGAASRIIKTLPKRKKGRMDPRIGVISSVIVSTQKFKVPSSFGSVW